MAKGVENGRARSIFNGIHEKSCPHVPFEITMSYCICSLENAKENARRLEKNDYEMKLNDVWEGEVTQHNWIVWQDTTNT